MSILKRLRLWILAGRAEFLRQESEYHYSISVIMAAQGIEIERQIETARMEIAS